MCHLVAGYPSAGLALAAAEAIISGGAAYLEIQFPFSDPTADGPLIQEACTRALEAGFSVDAGFRFVADLTARHPAVPVFVMTYASLAVRNGVGSFLEKASKAGAGG
jgi:tryptophan synthase alpha chain